MASSINALRQTISSRPRVKLGHALKEKLTLEKLAHLKHDGFCVIDNVFGSEWVNAAREEILLAKEHNCMQLNHTHLLVPDQGSNQMKRELVAKEKIYELDCLVNADLGSTLEHAGKDLMKDTSLREIMHDAMPELGLLKGQQPLKLQLNEGSGGCFPIHTDASLAVGDKPSEGADGRIVTALLYLNPQWKPDHGGQLRLYPILEDPVDIDPIADRMVCLAQRQCFTQHFHQPQLMKSHGAVPFGFMEMVRKVALFHDGETWSRSH